jgi:hemoglobin/transferrin/lactoferrin receptor protein
MFNRTLALMAGAFVGTLCLQAQTITVRDQVTREPIPAVVLTCASTSATATTNSEGRADITGLKACASIRIEHISYAGRMLSWSDLVAAPVLKLTYRVNMLNEVVTSASRFEEKKRDVPERIEVIDRRSIRFMDQPSMADLLQNTGSAFVQKSQGGGGSPIIRGFEANRILLVVDGVRMNNAIYRAGHVQDVITVDQSMLDRVEVVSGPNSVAYGSDALGGTIHMITRTPKFRSDSGRTVLSDAFFRYGTAANEKTAHAGVELRGARLASFTSITASDFGDLRQGSTRSPFNEEQGAVQFVVVRENGVDVVERATDRNLQLGSGYQQLDVLQKLRMRTGERLVHQLNLQLSTSSDVPRYDRTSLFSYNADGTIRPSRAAWYYGPQRRLLAAYTLELGRTNRYFDKARFTPSYQRIGQSRHDRRFNDPVLGTNTETVGVLAFNADLEKRSGKNEYRYGAEYSNNDVKSKASGANIVTGEVSYRPSRYPTGGSSMRSIAAYLSHTLELSPKVVVSEGLRFTNVRLEATFKDSESFSVLNGTYVQDNSALTWRAGAMYQPGHDWRISLLASTGFRVPNVDDMGKVFESTIGTVVVPNTSLRPETTTNFETSVSKTFDKRVTIDLNAFHTLYTNALSVDAARSNGQDSILFDGVLSKVVALTNKREAYLYGASGQFTAHVDDHFTLRSGLTYTYARIRTDSTDRPLDHTPPVYGRTGLEFQANKLRMETYVMYNGWKRLRDYNLSDGSEDNIQYATSVGTPSWFTLNARASYAFTRHLSAQVALENIMDAYYRVFASGISAPGRNFQISLRGNF